MSITNNNDSSNGSNNENNKKSKENLRELGYLIEEERLLADLKRKSEETLQKLKVEELTLLRFVRGLADASGGGDKPIMLSDNSLQSNFISSSASSTSSVSNGSNSQIINSNSSSTAGQSTQSLTNDLPSNASSINTSNTIRKIEQNVNNTEVLKLNVDNILMTIDNDQENEVEMDD